MGEGVRVIANNCGTCKKGGSSIVNLGLLPRHLRVGAPLLLVAAMGSTAPVDGGPRPVEYAQMTIEQSLVVRVPRRQVVKPLKWKSKKGPRCIAMSAIAGAAVVADDAIDLAMRGGQRLRAHFSSNCPALDYYSGFYILPTDDGRICADRDMIRTRSGGQCEIVKFRRLVPKN
jgi:hypothetical protein